MVPVWQTVKGAYQDTFGRPGAAATAAVVPFILSVLIEVASLAQQNVGFSLLRVLLDTLAVALFELAWLRHLLLGRPARPPLIPSLDRRLRAFAAYALLLSMLVLPAILVQTFFTETAAAAPAFHTTIVVILYSLGTYLCVRFGLVFPAISVDGLERLGSSWRRTRRNGLRILVASVLAGLPLLLPLFAFGIAVHAASPELGAKLEAGTFDGPLWWAVLAAGQALLYVYYALSCAVLARAFGVLTGWISNRQELLDRFE